MFLVAHDASSSFLNISKMVLILVSTNVLQKYLSEIEPFKIIYSETMWRSFGEITNQKVNYRKNLRDFTFQFY